MYLYVCLISKYIYIIQNTHKTFTFFHHVPYTVNLLSQNIIRHMVQKVDVLRAFYGSMYRLNTDTDKGAVVTSNSSSKTRGAAALRTRITWTSSLDLEEPSLKL